MPALVGDVSQLATRTTLTSPVDRIPTPGVAAHRGFNGINPENTMVAFRNAAAHPGVALEMDVRALADGTLVLSHEPTIDNVSATGQKGEVRKMTTAQWRAHKVKHPAGGTPAPAAFLSEVLEEFGGTDTVLMPELKKDTSREAFIEALWPYREQIVVQAFNIDNVSVLVRSGFHTVQLTTNPEGNYIPGIWAIGIRDAEVNTTAVRRAHAVGARVWVWGDDLTPPVPRLEQLGIDGYIADYPQGWELVP